MAHLDRLSALIARVDVHAERLTSSATGNLAVVGSDAAPERLVLCREGRVPARVARGDLLPVRIDLGGDANPLFEVLADRIEVDLTQDTALAGIAVLIRSEAQFPRCGGAFALERLCQLLVVSLLRHQIETAQTEPGVLAGLAHPKLSRVLVAMHEAPERLWKVDDFLGLAGMSRSHFMAEFQAVVGAPPMAYLKSWRMGLARSAVLRGDRINTVAARLGYRNADAFSRAFTAVHGVAPSRLREGVAA